MKYKKQIATGALALSLLVSGSSVFAASPQDLGIKNSQPTYQRQNGTNKNTNNPLKAKKKKTVVGTITAISGTSFTMEIKNKKTKVVTSEDVITDSTTVIRKNGTKVAMADLAVGQKVIVAGKLDKTTNTIMAKTVKIVAVKSTTK